MLVSLAAVGLLEFAPFLGKGWATFQLLEGVPHGDVLWEG
jgi:hypothetical protein